MKRRLSTITLEAEVRLTDVMEEMADDDLIEELKERGYNVQKYIIDSNEKNRDYRFPEFKNQIEQQNFIKAVLGLKVWHEKARIINEINDIFQ